VRQALERTRGNQTQAAKILGLSRFGLQKMIARLGIRTGVRAEPD
jgi:DNA-binding protein Fis